MKPTNASALDEARNIVERCLAQEYFLLGHFARKGEDDVPASFASHREHFRHRPRAIALAALATPDPSLERWRRVLLVALGIALLTPLAALAWTLSG